MCYNRFPMRCIIKGTKFSTSYLIVCTIFYFIPTLPSWSQLQAAAAIEQLVQWKWIY